MGEANPLNDRPSSDAERDRTPGEMPYSSCCASCSPHLGGAREAHRASNGQSTRGNPGAQNPTGSTPVNDRQRRSDGYRRVGSCTTVPIHPRVDQDHGETREMQFAVSRHRNDGLLQGSPRTKPVGPTESNEWFGHGVGERSLSRLFRPNPTDMGSGETQNPSPTDDGNRTRGTLSDRTKPTGTAPRTNQR